MRSWVLTGDRHEPMRLEDRNEPGLTSAQVRVEVRAAALNNRDLFMCDEPQRPGLVPLSDGAGEVVEVGSGVADLRPGDRVAGGFFAGCGLRNFLLAARGETPDWQLPPDQLGADWAADFRAAAAQLRDVWRAADLDRPVTMPGGGQAPLRGRADQQIAELAVHGWDLARATGQQADLDPAVARHALGWSQQMLRPEFRGPDKAFGPEVAVSADAPIYQRLAGWFGRDPEWTQPG